jgi:PAS domain S-box-containing protein
MPSIPSGAAVAAALSELAKLLSAGLDVTRVQESILDVVSEMVGPSRASLLRSTETGESFSIAAQRGLAPQVVRSVRLPSAGGLPLWLAREGRPVHAEEVQSQAAGALGRDVARELTLLRAVVAVPLLAQGELVAILALGPRITGVPYRRDQLEALFDVGAQAAATIRNARLHHQLQYARVYGARVLSSMSSGVVSIDHRQRVIVVNRRAEEILGLSAAEALDRDLRCLPSPLGDLLYEALRTERSRDRIEVQLARPRIVLEASAYPIAVGDAPATGAAIVFDDVSAARQLAAEKRRREQVELVASLVRLMTHAVRRPLMAVQAAVQRLEGVRETAGLGDELVGAMRRDVRQLVETTEKLSALLGEGELTFELVDIGKVVEECFGDLGAEAGARPSEEEGVWEARGGASREPRMRPGRQV